MNRSASPFEDAFSPKRASPCILVIFGVTGDLTKRKILPALLNLSKEGLLPSNFACIGFARRDKTDKEFQKEIISLFPEEDPQVLEIFSKRFFYHQSQFDDPSGYTNLKHRLKSLDHKFKTKRNVLFYLATPPDYFSTILKQLSVNALVNKNSSDKQWSRIIVEKPFGHDLQSSRELQQMIDSCIGDEAIYRIDHYLGKETVQNLLVLRFANTIFDSLWNKNSIDHIQITVAENQGVGTRGAFFEKTGIIRDILQNHILQIISLLAMEKPTSLNPDVIKAEKVKVFKALRKPDLESLSTLLVKGQYDRGLIYGEEVKAYQQEDRVDPNSTTETYAAHKLYVDTDRFQDIPFYLRVGKRLPKRSTEIAILFKEKPTYGIFQECCFPLEKNTLAIRIQPDEGVSFKINGKVPGQSMLIQPVTMNFCYSDFFGTKTPEAYERLILDCMMGDKTLFASKEEVDLSWQYITPLLEASSDIPPYPYVAGSWGPPQASELFESKKHKWRLL